MSCLSFVQSIIFIRKQKKSLVAKKKGGTVLIVINIAKALKVQRVLVSIFIRENTLHSTAMEGVVTFSLSQETTGLMGNGKFNFAVT